MKIRSIFRFAVMVSLVLAVFAGSFALANTETSDVVTNVFEPVPANWFFAGLNGVEGVTVNVPTEDGFISDTIEFKCELNEENWQKAFYQSSSTEEVRWPVGIVIPEGKNAIEASSMGTDFLNDDSKAMNYIASNDYYNIDNNRRVEQSIELATVSYGDSYSYMRITPKTWQRAYLFKWKDDQDVEHFHRINIKWTHQYSDVAVNIPVAVPSNERIVMNSTGHGGISAEYDDGTVVYLVETQQELNTAVTTGIYPPNGIDAAYVRVKLQSGGSRFYSVGTNIPALLSISADATDRSEDTFRLEWMDEQGNILKREVIAIQALPKWNGTWMGEHWIPVKQNPVNDINVGSYLSYEDGILTFSVDSNNMDGLNPEELCEKREYWYITVPEGATHFKYNAQHNPLYGAFAESTKQFFESTGYIAVQDAEGGDLPFRFIADEGCLAVSFGPIFKKASLKDQENLTVYIVDDSLAGYADMLHIQWYKYDDTNGYSLIQRNNKDGEYLCMVKEPAISEEKVLSQEPSGPVLNATAVIKDPNSPYHKATLRCEIPVQQQNGGDYILSYMKLTLHDEAGNEINLQPGTKMTIYIPYPEGITHQTAQNYDFSVRHYLDDDHSRFETIKVRREGIKGLAFDTTSFSPFLIMCEPTFSNSGTSGISVTYNGGNSFSTSNSAVPTSVEIDGIPVAFTGNGREFTVSGIPAGAKWITVRWNSTSITTNFAPDGNVVSAGIEIPKTGDKPIWTAVAAFFGF